LTLISYYYAENLLTNTVIALEEIGSTELIFTWVYLAAEKID